VNGWRNENKYLMPKYFVGPMTSDFLQDLVSGICFRCRLDNPRRFPNFQLPTIGVTADFYILHFLDNRRCSYTINFVQRKHNFCCFTIAVMLFC
jgi:hypothetical protein